MALAVLAPVQLGVGPTAGPTAGEEYGVPQKWDPGMAS